MSWKRTSRCVSKNYLKKDFKILYDPEIYFLIFTRKVIIDFDGSPLMTYLLWMISASSIANFINSEIS